MYPYLFGNSALVLYDLIGIFGYLLIVAYFLWKKTWSVPLDGESAKSRVWSTVLPLLVHVVAYTFAGERLGRFINRGTEFFGYVALSAVAMVLAALSLGAKPLDWLDKTAPLYPLMAAVLKLSCFSWGCCNGVEWLHGLYNHSNQRWEFPIQLVEAALYGLLTVLVIRYKGRPGQRFALFLTVYAGIRFAIQFFRDDVAVFTPFHWLSGAFLVIGGVCWVLFSMVFKKAKEE